MGGDDDHDRKAAAYWTGLAKAGAQKSQSKPRRSKATSGTMPDENKPESTDTTDPLALIVEAIRDNSDAIKAAAAEMGIARQTMAEAERKIALRADTASSEMRSLTLAVQQLTAREDTIRRLRAARWLWGVGGLMVGAVLTSVAVNELPRWWRQIFG
jgi:hypothetical protein